MEWYEKVHIFELQLLNGEWRKWTTKLTFEDAKMMIGSSSFIEVSYRDEEVTHINTKVIKTISDVTEETRVRKLEQKRDIEERFAIVQEIRSISLSPFHQWRYGLKKKTHDLCHLDLQIGLDLDPLMQYNKDYLNQILERCKNKSLKVS